MRPIADLSLRMKTRLALLGVLALFMVFGAVALDRMNALHQAATALGQTALPDARLVGDIDILVSNYRAAEADYLLAGDAAQRQAVRPRLEDLRGRLDARLRDAAEIDLPSGPAADARATVLATWPTYVAASTAMLSLADAGRMAAAADAFRAAGAEFETLGSALHLLLAAGEDAHAEARLQIQRAADQTRWLTLTVGTGLLIIGFAMVLLFEASLVATAQRLLAAMRQVAAGDTRTPVPHVERDDEFGDLARAVRAFANGLDGQRRRELELRAQVGTDELTGVANRRAFLERADDEINRSLRYGNTLSLLMLDIDLFKQVNDTYGHAAGDAALKRLVEACRPALREHDMLARLGGEEFVVLLPHTDAARALLVAERLRDAVERAGVETPAGLFHITVSIGSATLPPGTAPDATAEALSMLLERADKALYRAKHGGRNCVVSSVQPAA
ncbi:MAG: diguanylate cyclase [Rhodospirillaceae bacterium]